MRGAQLEAAGADSRLLWSGLRSAFFSSLLWHLSRWRLTGAQRKYGFREAVPVPALGWWQEHWGCLQASDATQEAATPVKAFLSDALGWAASLPQPMASWKEKKKKAPAI